MYDPDTPLVETVSYIEFTTEFIQMNKNRFVVPKEYKNVSFMAANENGGIFAIKGYPPFNCIKLIQYDFKTDKV